MLYKIFLFTVTLAGMLAIIPLAVWGGSGSARQGWNALKSYLFCMGVIVVPVLVVFVITELPWLWSQLQEAIRSYL